MRGIRPGEASLRDARELAFVTHPGLRDGLQRDLGAARRALGCGDWRAATLLAGFVLEALLHWSLRDAGLDRETPAGHRGLDSAEAAARTWSLVPSIEAALRLGLIRAQTAGQASLVADYRSLIDPAAAVRIRRERRALPAFAATAAVELLIADLAAR